MLTSQLLSITVPCNTDLRAGDIITCKFPKVSREDSERFDPETSGKYLIKELCHHFDPDRSFTSMNTGIRSFFARQPTVVEKVRAGVITSLFFGRLRDSTPI